MLDDDAAADDELEPSVGSTTDVVVSLPELPVPVEGPSPLELDAPLVPSEVPDVLAPPELSEPATPVDPVVEVLASPVLPCDVELSAGVLVDVTVVVGVPELEEAASVAVPACAEPSSPQAPSHSAVPQRIVSRRYVMGQVAVGLRPRCDAHSKFRAIAVRP